MEQQCYQCGKKVTNWKTHNGHTYCTASCMHDKANDLPKYDWLVEFCQSQWDNE